MLQTADSHKQPDTLEPRFVKVSGLPDAKHLEVLKCFSKKREGAPRTMVFCNTVASCRSLGHFLSEQGVPNVCLHGDIPKARRSEEYRRFIAGESNVLVCTDAAARGLDIDDVAHVILFDFPRDVAEYLHRVGRTARAGARGRVTAFVARYDYELAKSIQLANRSDQPLMSMQPTVRRERPQNPRRTFESQRPVRKARPPQRR